jgi:hypothetical protein
MGAKAMSRRTENATARLIFANISHICSLLISRVEVIGSISQAGDSEVVVERDDDLTTLLGHLRY